MQKLKYFVFAVAILVFARCSNNEELEEQIAEAKVSATARTPRYPSYNTSPLAPDATGMTSNAVQIASQMRLGINIGNTLEAIGGETAWGNPLVTQALIDSYKQAGFNTIRIPCSWDQYANQQTAQIQAQWLERVKQVVQYCINDGMYVILNIHWDGGWLDANINSRSQAAVNAKQKAFWEQIATKMRDFDEHLLFAGSNEPPAKDAAQMSILLSYHQTFINAVRSTGGRNSYRVLVVQGPSTDIQLTNDLMNTMPSDQVANRLMTEVHYYTPYQFCLMTEDATWGKMFYYWGAGHHSTIEPDRNATWGEEADVLKYFGMMKTKFADKGIPVILGEYGAYRRDGSTNPPLDLATHNDAVDYWAEYVTHQAKASGILPFWWDTGGAIDRRTYVVKDQRTINALNRGAQ
jgi:endoglucanase